MDKFLQNIKNIILIGLILIIFILVYNMFFKPIPPAPDP